MPASRTISTVEMHTAGEPFRIVTGGVEEPRGGTILERRRDALERLDHVRRLLGARSSLGANGCCATPTTSGAA